MQAKLIRRTSKGITIKSEEGKPIRIDEAANRMLQQRAFRKRLVPLEHNGGMPIRRAT